MKLPQRIIFWASSTAIAIITFLHLPSTTFAQPLYLLQGIEYDAGITGAGLSQTFYGKTLTDGKLYFTATFKLSPKSIWVTDGTVDGTTDILVPDSYSHWKREFILDKAIFIAKNDNHLYSFDVHTEVETDLGSYGMGGNVHTPIEIADNDYAFRVNRDDIVELWRTDLTQAGTKKITDLGEELFGIDIKASSAGAILYRRNSTTYAPKFYNFATDTLSDLISYLSPLVDIEKIISMEMYKNFIFISGTHNFQFVSFVYDANTHTVYDAPSLRTVREYIEYNGYTYIINSPFIHRFDTSDKTLVKVGDQLGVLSNTLRDDNIIYHVHDENNFEDYPLYAYDLNTETSVEIPGTNVGRDNYDNPMALHGNHIYYSKKEYPHFLLYRHNLPSGTTELVDTISYNSGAVTVGSVIASVHGRVVVSVFGKDQAHELFYLEDNSGTLQPFNQAEQIETYPNPASDVIYLRDISVGDNAVCNIFDSNGKLTKTLTLHGDRIDVTNLPNGQYFGQIIDGNRSQAFNFIILRE